jgi:serine protease inhibitor
VANAAWVSNRAPIVPRFIDRAKRYYGAEATNLDFLAPGAASTINKWVDSRTRGRIRHIAGGLDDSTVLCLTNAVYFKGTWTHRFDRELTSNLPFTLADGSVKSVPMMRQDGRFRYCQTDSFEAVALPYGSGRMSMYVFLSNRNSSLSSFLSAIGGDAWKQWPSRFEEKKLRVLLPRWKLESHADLRGACERIGMGIAFDPDKSDFRAMCRCDGPNNVYIGTLKQEAFVEVNEEGTEAAAASFELFRARSGWPEFRANRPFFYAIRDDQTGALLFMGLVADPLVSDASLG